MADEKTWKLSEIRDLWRELTGRPSTGQISDVNVNKEINDYYVNHFSHDAKVDEFDVFYTQALSATDTGVYSIASNIDRFDDPVTINGREIVLYRDRELFFGTDDYHHDYFLHGHFHGARTHLHGQYKDEQFITDPTLAIGTSDTTKVKHSDFDYVIQSKSYSKSSSEVALTGDAIPQGLYGAWSLKIDVDGTITVAAGDNATGYATPRIALDALGTADADSAYMGYVTVTKSDGAFTPDTTALGAANVTGTYTDGKFENRGEPVSALLYGSNLYVRPKPNDIYEFEALSIADRPTAFADDNAVPDDAKWGAFLAAAPAVIFLERNGEDATNAKVDAARYLSSISSDKIKRLLGQVVQRSF